MKSKVALLCKTDRVMHLEFLQLKEIGHGDQMNCKTKVPYTLYLGTTMTMTTTTTLNNES